MQNFAVYAGTKQPLRQRLINRWSPLNGLTQTTEWMGFGDDEMNALAQQAADAGFEYEYIDDHGVFHLTAVDTSGAVTADTWGNRCPGGTRQQPQESAAH